MKRINFRVEILFLLSDSVHDTECHIFYNLKWYDIGYTLSVLFNPWFISNKEIIISWEVLKSARVLTKEIVARVRLEQTKKALH